MRSALEEIVGYVGWATAAVIDACRALTPAQLDAPVAGGFGSIRETLTHVVGSDAAYLARLAPSFERPATDPVELDDLAAEMERHRAPWREVVREGLDPDRITVTERRDGTFFQATVGIRILQVVQHATDHLSQVNTALTLHGIEAPWIGGWDYGESTGAVVKYAEGPER